MVVQFENKYYAEDAMLKEYVDEILCWRTKRMGLFFSAMSAVMLVITLIGRDYIFTAIYGVCFLLTTVLSFLISPLTFRELKENGQYMNNGKVCETVVRFGDCILITEGTFSLTVEYSQITEIYYLEKSCVLMFGKRNGILLDPNGFGEHAFKDFQIFIEGKAKNRRRD